ncbi:aspartate--tRNA ligase [bacterium]|nr:aspartate--tRNA ligase [bacterium]
MGWVQHRRDHGGVIFIDLRDRHGLTQIVFNPERNHANHAAAEDFRNEYVLYVEGEVETRPADALNPNLSTGEIEVRVDKVRLLNSSEPTPFPIDDSSTVTEEMRLTYRYLDFRMEKMNKALAARHRITHAVRNFLNAEGFLEIETPLLTKSTPEGARDYLVPSRVNPGSFYALPQSPQIMKQLLMVGGIDKYFQICRCFRDEDLRADRQPEFTQIDMEMSYVNQDEIFRVTEGVVAAMFKAGINKDIAFPFPRYTHKEVLDRYGIDKPDTRFGLELFTATEILSGSDFKIFNQTIEQGGIIKGLVYPGGVSFSRKELDDLTAFVGKYGAKGLAWFKFTGEGVQSPIAKFFSHASFDSLRTAGKIKEGDIAFFVCDKESVVNESLAALRNHLGHLGNLIPEGVFNLLWVVDFPLFKYNDEEKRLESEHHPFTAPLPDDLHLLETHPLKVRSSSYDLVLNGTEVASGSIRIHNFAFQQKIFQMLGLEDQEIEEKFGFFINALRYGAPPHGGIAPGLDRIVTIMLGLPSIRDVIAFPKTQKASCLMTQSPSSVSEKQLKDLRLRITK